MGGSCNGSGFFEFFHVYVFRWRGGGKEDFGTCISVYTPHFISARTRSFPPLSFKCPLLPPPRLSPHPLPPPRPDKRPRPNTSPSRLRTPPPPPPMPSISLLPPDLDLNYDPDRAIPCLLYHSLQAAPPTPSTAPRRTACVPSTVPCGYLQWIWRGQKRMVRMAWRRV